MKAGRIFVFGNEDISDDSLPIRIMSKLADAYPDIFFDYIDPNEEWDIPEKITVIDTAIGINDVTVFDDLKKFSQAPNLSMHDFDALSNLRYMQKLGKLKEVKIIAVPPQLGEIEALDKVKKCIDSLE